MRHFDDAVTALYMESDSSSDQTDADAIRSVLKGETEAFRILVDRYKDRIFSLCMRQCGNREIAEELTQDVFLRAYRALSRFRFEATFATWITRIALNVVQSYFASARYRESRISVRFDPDTHDRASSSAFPTPALTEKFHDCFAKLGARFREVLALVALEERSYEETAQLVGIPVGTVRSRLHAARLALKRCIFEEVAL
ncbi:MAG: sigma-70 family RNA polymerase sigma factor [Bdellovibrionota bacterium]|nr:MAG: sigma-70 family RNA polymerase sigma factor [Bdellovibrionota bacterium]